MKRRIWSAFVVLCLCVTGFVATPSVAQATSDYDDLLRVTDTLTVYTDGATKTQNQDISQTWWHDFKQTYQKRLSQGLGWPSGFVPAMEAVMANGSWGVYTTEDDAGKIVTIVGTSDANASCGFYGSGSSSGFNCTIANGASFLKTEYFTHASYGGNGCWGGGGDRCSDNGMNVYSAPTYYSSTPGGAWLGWPAESLLDVELFMMNFDANYPTGYEGEILPSQETLDYVALGDSFSSGEGVEPFLSGTDVADDSATSGVDEENRCHRSEAAYPLLLDADNSQKKNLELTAFAACSGATTDTLLNGGSGIGSWGEDPQIDALSSSTDVVTLTIGGNDLGFADVLRSCIQGPNSWADDGWGCASDTGITDAVGIRMDALEETPETAVSPPGSTQPIHTIRSVIDSIASQAVNAKIRVAGYPHLFGSTWTDFTANVAAPGLAQCSIAVWGGTVSVSYTDTQWINAQVDELNSIINAAVTDAHNQGVDVEYVAPSAFESHALCDSGASYLYSLFLEGDLADPSVLSKSFHPTANGTSAYKSAFAGMLN